MEPLFLTPVMHEKIWGGNRLRTNYHYDIPSDKTGECWAISAHPNGVTTVSNGQYKGRGLDDLHKNEKHLFGNPTDDVF
ncbi:TPA: mannose-6-phosphate isomerase, partial [Streptococcus suis]|nr:mannose-6-phosphate isomerase [Streptococcus suis]